MRITPQAKMPIEWGRKPGSQPGPKSVLREWMVCRCGKAKA